MCTGRWHHRPPQATLCYSRTAKFSSVHHGKAMTDGHSRHTPALTPGTHCQNICDKLLQLIFSKIFWWKGVAPLTHTLPRSMPSASHPPTQNSWLSHWYPLAATLVFYQLNAIKILKTAYQQTAQSNLGGGPCRRESPHWLQWRAPNSPPKVPLPVHGPIAKPHSCLIPGPVRPWCQTASGSDPPSFHNALDRPTHGQTDRYRALRSKIGAA